MQGIPNFSLNELTQYLKTISKSAEISFSMDNLRRCKNMLFQSTKF